MRKIVDDDELLDIVKFFGEPDKLQVEWDDLKVSYIWMKKRNHILRLTSADLEQRSFLVRYHPNVHNVAYDYSYNGGCDEINKWFDGLVKSGKPLNARNYIPSNSKDVVDETAELADISNEVSESNNCTWKDIFQKLFAFLY